jgi:DNA polymerase I-like protein with 3'-5' exonuclease and polymerase domains
VRRWTTCSSGAPEYGLGNPGSGRSLRPPSRPRAGSRKTSPPPGRAKLDKGILSGIPHELGDLVIQYKRLQKWDGSYLRNFQKWDDNGRLHGNIKQCEARTGRMSVVNPALQTIPRGPIIRDCFIPGEGNSLLTVDYAQIELRMLAHFSQDD